MKKSARIESAPDHVDTPATSEADAELATASAQEPNVAPRKAKATKKAAAAKNAPKGKKAAKAKGAAGPRAGSKMAQVIAMMQLSPPRSPPPATLMNAPRFCFEWNISASARGRQRS